MRVTCILKDFTEEFYNGLEGCIPAFLALSDADKFAELCTMAREKRISMKIESGQMRDAVEFNSLLKRPHSIAFKIEPRKGYKLATFEFSRI